MTRKTTNIRPYDPNKVRKSNFKDLSGKRFNRWLVKEFIGYTGNGRKTKAVFSCLCDCGKSANVRSDLLSGNGSKSCGCLQKEIAILQCKKRALPEGEAAKNSLYKKYKFSSPAKLLGWELSFEESMELFFSCCFYCGKEPSQIWKSSLYSILYNGIDRLDSTKGYTHTNVVTCCKGCNFLKVSRPFQEFIDQVSRIYQHLQKTGIIQKV